MPILVGVVRSRVLPWLCILDLHVSVLFQVARCLLTDGRYYRRLELQVRINVFFCASITAGAVSGLLAYGIAHMDGVAGYTGWRWIFILEGQ